MGVEMLSRRQMLRLSVLAAGSAALAACGATPAPTATTAPTQAPLQEEAAPTATAAVQEPAAEVTVAGEPSPAAKLSGKIEYYSYDLGPANESREGIKSAFEEAHPEAKVTLTFLPYGENWDKLAALMASGTPPDVIYGDFSLLKHALADQLLDMNDQIAADPVLSDASKFTVDMRDPVIAKLGTSHVYQLPLGTWVPLLYYNRELFDAAGQTHPDETWTWDDLREVAQKLTDPANARWGFQWGTIFDIVGELWWLQQPKDFWAVPQAFPETSDFNNEVGITTFSQFHTYGEAGDKSSVPSAEMGGFSVYGAAFGAGKAAMTLAGDWDAGWGYRDLPFPWAVTYVPMLKEGYRANLNVMWATSAIAKGTKNPQLAWEFARFISASPEGQKFIGQGAYETPVLREVAESDAVLKPDWAQPGYDYRVKAAELPGPSYCVYPLNMNLWEFPSKFIDPTVEKLRLGEMKPEEAVAYLDQEGKPYFEKQKADMPPVS